MRVWKFTFGDKSDDFGIKRWDLGYYIACRIVGILLCLSLQSIIKSYYLWGHIRIPHVKMKFYDFTDDRRKYILQLISYRKCCWNRDYFYSDFYHFLNLVISDKVVSAILLFGITIFFCGITMSIYRMQIFDYQNF